MIHYNDTVNGLASFPLRACTVQFSITSWRSETLGSRFTVINFPLGTLLSLLPFSDGQGRLRPPPLGRGDEELTRLIPLQGVTWPDATFCWGCLAAWSARSGSADVVQMDCSFSNVVRCAWECCGRTCRSWCTHLPKQIVTGFLSEPPLFNLHLMARFHRRVRVGSVR